MRLVLSLRAARVALAGVVAIGLAVSGSCSGDDDVAGDRERQVRDAAIEAGLPEAVADVLGLAARGASATFQITYEGDDGASIIVSQSPPDRRVDVLQSGLVVESTVVRDDVAYACSLPQDGRPGDDLDCERTSGEAEATGTFTAEALATFTEALAAALDEVELSVEDRTIAEVRATCLISAPKPGTVLDGSESVDTICVSDDGAQLLVDVGGERVMADAYSDEVPDGTFDT